MPPSDPACRPPGILIQATSLQGPNLPRGWPRAPASAGSAWETRTPKLSCAQAGSLEGRPADGSPLCPWHPSETPSCVSSASLRPVAAPPGLGGHRVYPQPADLPIPRGAIDISASPVKRGPQPSIHWFWEHAPFSREEHGAGSPETRSQESGPRKQSSRSLETLGFGLAS